MTNDTQVPTWLDLDQLVPPELRHALATVVTDLEQLEPVVKQLARRAHELLERHESALTGAGATGLHDYVGVLTGCSAMIDRCVEMSEQFTAVYDSFAPGTGPEWLRSENGDES